MGGFGAGGLPMRKPVAIEALRSNYSLLFPFEILAPLAGRGCRRRMRGSSTRQRTRLPTCTRLEHMAPSTPVVRCGRFDRETAAAFLREVDAATGVLYDGWSDTQFIQHHYRHFNAALAAPPPTTTSSISTEKGKLLVTLAGAMSTASWALAREMIRRDKVQHQLPGANPKRTLQLGGAYCYEARPNYRISRRSMRRRSWTGT